MFVLLLAYDCVVRVLNGELEEIVETTFTEGRFENPKVGSSTSSLEISTLLADSSDFMLALLDTSDFRLWSPRDRLIAVVGPLKPSSLLISCGSGKDL